MNNKYEVVDDKYEYRKIPLETKYIYIPLSIIMDKELDTRRVATFSFMRIRCSFDDIIAFNIPDIVEWCGGKPDRRANGTNDKFLFMIDVLSDRGYITYLTEKSKSSYMKCKMNMEYYYDDCSDGYAVVYLDEIKKIMDYQKENLKDGTLNNTTILLVFAYLRNKIFRRPNELKPEERSSEMVQKRRERIPEAYENNINIIADELNISSKTLSKIIDILEYDLKLIVTDRAYRIKNEDNEYRTLPTIFANAYKREDRYLLVTDDNYSREEIELKANTIQNYKINKNKRKK